MKNHKIIVINSKGVFGEEAVHTNVHILPKGCERKYGEFDLKETSQIIEINPDVKFPYLTFAVRTIINGGENTAPNASKIHSYSFDAREYDSLVRIIKENKSKLEEIKDGFDLDKF